MRERPYTLLSCCMSIDGYINDASAERLLLSNDADFDRVDAVRASCDAIMVGAGTIRADDPRLLVRSPSRREIRAERGLAPSPMKVTVSNAARLDPSASFFTTGDARKLVYCTSENVDDARNRLGMLATIVDGGPQVRMAQLSVDLHARGVGRLMVEGGESVHTQFLEEGLADELQLVVAPFFVGDSRAPRLTGDGHFPWNSLRPARLVTALPLGDAVLLRYALSPRFIDEATSP
ncbi:RibD family protein [Arthrobacter glacialis]|uniref:Deaminase n=1 Tax=Arthrobacter glacialis TaxID=1664 RepID=A0A2S3ZRC2_ARTGL|nr:dihydrofolate reductase family protein [Arthrobacter glacialis]POH71781.1 deaminase [Arthrobacter glacialis]